MVNKIKNKLRSLLLECGININTTSIVDRLIKKGVVVSPVNLGQTIFILEDIGIQTLPEIVPLNVYQINFTISEDGLDFHVICVTKTKYIQHIKGEDFGKTVFLTKAEAEQKLKEMRGE